MSRCHDNSPSEKPKFSIEKLANWIMDKSYQTFPCTGKPIFPIEKFAKFLITTFFWFSPYRFVDDWLKKQQKEAERTGSEWEIIRHKRYLLSEFYITGWFLFSLVLVAFNEFFPSILAYLLLFRIAGILNKELGVTLFGICKITEGRSISSSSRVILLALCSYFTSGFLFAFMYSKVGMYKITETRIVSGLPIDYAIVQAFSMQFMFSPAYTPFDLLARLFIICQSAFCLLFSTLIVSSFIGLLNISSIFKD